MIDRLLRATLLAAPLLATSPALAKEPSAASPPAAAPMMPAKGPSAAPSAKEPSVGQMAARERQKKCGAEWRGLTAAQKTAQGPKWPQFWSTCNKRLKGGDKA